jgi:hypothetical protein
MEFARYSNGRVLTYDEGKARFYMDGMPIAPQQVIADDLAGQLTWANSGLRTWAHQFVASADSGSAVALPANGWFTRLPMWGKVLFIFFYPVSIPYGIWALWKRGFRRFSQLPTWGKAIFIVLYPISIPYGVWAMWKDKKFSRVARIGITGAAVIFLLVVGIFAADHAKTTPTIATVAEEQTPSAQAPAPATIPAPAPVPQPQTTEGYLRATITDELGQKTNMGDKEVIRSIESQKAKGAYLLQLNADENLTTNMTKEGMWLDSEHLWKRVFTERSDIEAMTIEWVFPLVDVKGNSEDAIVMRLKMSKQNAADVNWDNVLLKNIPLIADEYRASNALNE